MNEKIELIRKLSFSIQLSDPDDYEGGNFQLLDEGGQSYIVPRQRGCIVLFDSAHNTEFRKSQKELVSLSLDGLLVPVGSEVEHVRF